MKKIIVFILLVLLVPVMPVAARDFIVQVEEENYKEEQSTFSYSPVIYHSIQVTSGAGPKLLVLTGDNYYYRNWIRRYISRDKAFIVKVPDDQTDQFITAIAFDIDVTRLHPLDLAQYKKGEERAKQMKDPVNAAQDVDQKLRALAMQREKAVMDRSKKAGDMAEKQIADKNKERTAEKEKKEARLKDQEKALEKEEQRRALEQEKILKALAEQKELQQERAREQAELFATLARQREEDENRRRQELEARWLELKQRLLEDERIRNLEIEARDREIQRRWLELQRTLAL